MRYSTPHLYSADPALDAARYYDWADAMQSAWECARDSLRDEFLVDVMAGRLAKLAYHMDCTDWTDDDHPWDECDDLRTYLELAAYLVGMVKRGSAKHRARLNDIADEYAKRMADLEQS